MTVTDEQIRSRVNAGVKLLDEKHPGWYKEINLDSLDISDCSQCILGQLYGAFAHGLEIVPREDPSFLYGFNFETLISELVEDSGSTRRLQEDEHRRLLLCWIDVIKSRRAENQ